MSNNNYVSYSDPEEIKSFVDSLIFRIDSQYYDLTNFSAVHPGGQDILIWSKRRAWDHTQFFAIHHVNYSRAVMVMKRFLIKDEKLIDRIQELEAEEVPKRFPKQLPPSTSKYYPLKLQGSGIEPLYEYAAPPDDKTNTYHISDIMMADSSFELPSEGSFYWELRDEIYRHFKKNNIDYYPTPFYMKFFWILAFVSIGTQCMQFYCRSYLVALLIGFMHAILGGFGHQFVHNPYKFRKYAYFALDWIGLYSYTFMVDHVANHHIYTNTIPDHHFYGTDPFVYVNPFIVRSWWRKAGNFIIANCTVLCGIFGNYMGCLISIIIGNSPFHPAIFIYPLRYVFMAYIVGDWLLAIKLTATATMMTSAWYFIIALMNHNQAENWNLAKLSKASKSSSNKGGWAEMQLVTSTDIGYNYGFIGSMLCLWLNYHTVHHLLPTVDMAHHQEAQRILNRVAAKHGLCYLQKSAWSMYWDMLQTFSMARALEVVME